MILENKNLQDEIYRKIGRNLFLLQKIECLLKELIFSRKITISSDGSEPPEVCLKKQIMQQREVVAGETMGGLRKLFCEGGYFESKNLPDDFGDLKWRMKIQSYSTDETGTPMERSYQPKLKEIVGERNTLVHELHIFFDKTSENFGRLDAFLDRQHEKIIPVHTELLELLNFSQKNLRKILLLADERDDDAFLKIPCAKELVVVLCIYSTFIGKKDIPGWACLAGAGSYISLHYFETLAECRRKFKTKLLRKILLGIGCFELQSQENGKGVSKTYYRMKPGCWIQHESSGELSFCRQVQVEGGGVVIYGNDLGLILTDDEIPEPNCLLN